MVEYPDRRDDEERLNYKTLPLMDLGDSTECADDDETFTVATVLRHKNPFRKPTDDSSGADKEGAFQLRATASLMDSSDEESEAECDHVGSRESAFSLSYRQEVVNFDEEDPSQTRRGGRRHSAERFNSVYSELAANEYQSLPASFATKRKRTQGAVRPRVTLSSTLKTLAVGISGLSWDEADYRRQKRRPLVDIDTNREVPPIGRSLSLQDEKLVRDQTRQCSELSRRLKRAEDENHCLRQDNKMTGHYKRLLKIAEEATQNDIDAANERAYSLSRELESVQCELRSVRQVKDEALRQIQYTRATVDSGVRRKDSLTSNDSDHKQLEAVERKLEVCEKELTLSKETAERSVIAAESLAKSLDAANEDRSKKEREIDELRDQVLSLREEASRRETARDSDVEKLEKEVARLKKDHSIRTRGLMEELQQAKGDLASANSLVAETRSIIQAFVKENNALRVTVRQLKDGWEREKPASRNQNR